MYNNRALVPDYAGYLSRWAQDSATVRSRQPCALDLAYGQDASETLDIFPGDASQPAPVLVFIHGGYWRSLDKADHSFIAPAFTRQGACVVVPNYALCPGTPQAPVTLPQIVLQMVQALVWVYQNIARYGGDPTRISVAGHSAGGHLAAMLLACDWPRYQPGLPVGLLRNALSVSGLHELDAIMHAPFLQQSLLLTSAQVLQCSPAWFPPPVQGSLYSVAGADESTEFARQCRLIQRSWGRARVPVCELLAGCNHFSVLNALAQPGHRLQQLGMQLLNGSKNR